MIPQLDAPQAQQQVGSVLRLTKRWLKLLALATAIAAWAAGTVMFVLTFVLCDHWWPGGLSQNTCTLSGFIYLVVTGLWLILTPGWLVLRHLNSLYAARLIERANPGVRNAITDALQLSKRQDLPGSVRAAVLSRAAEQLDNGELTSCLPRQRLRRVGYAFAGSLLAMGVYALISPKPVVPSMRRAFGTRLAAPTRTTIVDCQPADGTSVVRGQPVTFSAGVRGQRPTVVFARFSTDGGQTWLDGERIEFDPPAEKGSSPQWTATKAGSDVQRTLSWQIVAGDARSEVRQLRVRDLPAVVEVHTRYDYPKYTQLPPTTQPGGDIDALVGTQATVYARSNVACREPIMVVGRPPGEQRFGMAVASAPAQQIEGHISVTEDSVYQISFADLHGTRSRDPVEYHIRARADTPPRITVRQPAAVAELSPEAGMALDAIADDDFGLSQAMFCWRTKEGGERTLALTLTDAGDGNPRTSARLQENISVAKLDAKQGETVEWWVSVWDNREDLQGQRAWQRTDSEIGRLKIVAPPAVASGEANDRAGQHKSAEGGTPSSSPNNGKDALSTAQAKDRKQSSPETAGNDTGSPAAKATEESKDVSDSKSAEPGNKTASGDEQAANPSADREARAKEDTATAGKSDTTDGAKERVKQFADAHARELNAIAEHLKYGTSQPAEQKKGQNEKPKPTQREQQQQQNGQPGQSQGGQPKQSQGDQPGQNQAGQKEQGSQQAQGDQQAQENQSQQGQSKQPSNNQGEQEQTQKTQAGQSQANKAGESQGNQSGQSQSNQPGQEQGNQSDQDQGGAEPGQGQGNSQEEPQGQNPGQGQSQTEEQDKSETGTSPGLGGKPSDMQVQVPDHPQDDGTQPTGTLPQASSREPSLDTAGAVPRLVDELEIALRNDQVDPKLLENLGWNMDQAWQFVKEYHRQVGGPQKQTARTELPSRQEFIQEGGGRNNEILRATSGPSPAERLLGTTHNPGADRTNQLREAGRQRVPRSLAPVLRSYYQSLATNPADANRK